MRQLVKKDSSPARARRRFKNYHLIDYYTEPWEDVPAGTPATVIIAILDLWTGQHTVLSWDLIAEECGIRSDRILAKRDHLECLLLKAFLTHLRAHPNGRWLSWNLTNERY